MTSYHAEPAGPGFTVAANPRADDENTAIAKRASLTGSSLDFMIGKSVTALSEACSAERLQPGQLAIRCRFKSLYDGYILATLETPGADLSLIYQPNHQMFRPTEATESRLAAADPSRQLEKAAIFLADTAYTVLIIQQKSVRMAENTEISLVVYQPRTTMLDRLRHLFQGERSPKHFKFSRNYHH